YPEAGIASGEQVLRDLARHPATARHLAKKLARHFVSSTPPAPLVTALERTFLETGGDLGQVARTLVGHEASWSVPQRKVLPPYDFLVSLARGFDLHVPPRQIVNLARALGQPLWTPPSPKGWPDDDDAWLGPSSLRERLRLAGQFAARAAQLHDPVHMAQELLGTAISDAEMKAIRRAESRAQGTELLIMSPAFQRR
ncbi:MAG: DUF1800 family protein, partial [Hyphomicrobiaceae bacterium]